MATRIWKLELEIEVDDVWIGDGFEATPERIKECLENNLLTWAYLDEEVFFRVKAISGPSKSTIRKIQGYID
jgi:hypothetical protein